MNWFRRLDDRWLISPKVIYFTICSVFYAFYIFRAKFIKNYLALDDHEYGDISAAMALVSFAFMALWSSLADSLGRHRTVLLILCVTLTGSFELTSLVAGIESDGVRFLMATSVMVLYSFFSCGILPLTDFIILKMLSNRPGFSKDLYGRQRLWGTVSYGITSVCTGATIKAVGIRSLFLIVPLNTLVCALVLLFLAPADSPRPMKQVLSAFCGRQQDQPDKLAQEGSPREPTASQAGQGQKQGEQSGSNDQLIPVASVDEGDSPTASSSSSEDLKKTLNAPPTEGGSAADDADPKTVAAPSKQKKPILQLITNPNYMFMLFVVFMTGSARTVMTIFLSKYWDERMKLTDTEVGIAANFGILLEIVLFFFGPNCIRVLGTYWMLIIAQLAMVVRGWAYVFIPPASKNFWLVYLVELLKGVAFGLTQIAGVKLASEAAPNGLEATAQALYTSVYSQLPAVLTALAGGRVYKAYGPLTLFCITAAVSSVALALFVLKYFLDGSIGLCGFRLRRRPEGPNAAGN